MGSLFLTCLVMSLSNLISLSNILWCLWLASFYVIIDLWCEVGCLSNVISQWFFEDLMSLIIFHICSQFIGDQIFLCKHYVMLEQWIWPLLMLSCFFFVAHSLIIIIGHIIWSVSPGWWVTLFTSWQTFKMRQIIFQRYDNQGEGYLFWKGLTEKAGNQLAVLVAANMARSWLYNI